MHAGWAYFFSSNKRTKGFRSTLSDGWTIGRRVLVLDGESHSAKPLAQQMSGWLASDVDRGWWRGMEGTGRRGARRADQGDHRERV